MKHNQLSMFSKMLFQNLAYVKIFICPGYSPVLAVENVNVRQPILVDILSDGVRVS